MLGFTQGKSKKFTRKLIRGNTPEKSLGKKRSSSFPGGGDITRKCSRIKPIILPRLEENSIKEKDLKGGQRELSEKARDGAY